MFEIEERMSDKGMNGTSNYRNINGEMRLDGVNVLKILQTYAYAYR